MRSSELLMTREGKGEVKRPHVEVCIVHIIATDAAHEHLSIEGIVPPNVIFIPCTPMTS